MNLNLQLVSEQMLVKIRGYDPGFVASMKNWDRRERNCVFAIWKEEFGVRRRMCLIAKNKIDLRLDQGHETSGRVVHVDCCWRNYQTLHGVWRSFIVLLEFQEGCSRQFMMGQSFDRETERSLWIFNIWSAMIVGGVSGLVWIFRSSKISYYVW